MFTLLWSATMTHTTKKLLCHRGVTPSPLIFSLLCQLAQVCFKSLLSLHKAVKEGVQGVPQFQGA